MPPPVVVDLRLGGVELAARRRRSTTANENSFTAGAPPIVGPAVRAVSARQRSWLVGMVLSRRRALTRRLRAQCDTTVAAPHISSKTKRR